MLMPDFYIDAFNNVIQNAREIIEAYLQRKDIKQEHHWDALMAAVDTVRKLVLQHLEAIKFATDPLLEHDDLVATSKNLRALVNNDDFPMGYDLLRGEIKRCSQLEAFSKAARALMIELLQRLRDFQLAAFMIDPDTWRKGELPSVVKLYAFDHAVTLLPLLKKPEKSADEIKSINDLGTWIMEQFSETPKSLHDTMRPPVFKNGEQLIALAKNWSRTWVRQCRAPLVLGDGVMNKVGALQAQRHAG